MAIPEVTSENNRQLQNIANTLAAAKKVVVFTGAGISTNCGIPVSLRSFYLNQIIANHCCRTSARSKDSTPSYKPNATPFPYAQPLATSRGKSSALPLRVRIREIPRFQSPAMLKAKTSLTLSYGKIPLAPQSSILSSHLSAVGSAKM